MTVEVDLFVYGTLMDEGILSSLTGRHFPRREAELFGFERIIPKNGYPYIIPKSNARVQGFLLSGVGPSTLAMLDDYEEEGRLYHRCRVEILIARRRMPCETYVGNVAALTAYFYDTSQTSKR